MKLIGKVVLPVAFVTLMVIISVAIFSNWFVKREFFKEAYLERKEDVSRNIATLLTEEYFLQPMEDQSQKAFEVFAASIQSADVLRVTFWNPDEQVMYSDLKSIIGKKARNREDLKYALERTLPAYYEKEMDNGYPQQTSVGPIHDMFFPVIIGDRSYGVIEMQVSSSAIGATIDRNLRLIFIQLIVAAFIIYIALLLIVKRIIIRPLEKISAACVRVEQGDLDAEVVIRANDEIGIMARAFNTMRVALKSSLEESEKCRLRAIKSEEKAKEQLKEIERINDLMVGRELRIAELKKHVETCEAGCKTKTT
jgi:HAMP domain-containing protein